MSKDDGCDSSSTSISGTSDSVRVTRVSLILFGSMGVAVACLRWLLEQPYVDVLGVVCSRQPRSRWRAAVQDEDMQEEAPRWGIPLLTLEEVAHIEADLGLSVRYHEILRQRHLQRFRLGVVNLHGAPLPEMRGSMCDAAALLEGREHFGTSLHWMDEGIDTGPIIAVERFPIEPHHTVYHLFQHSNERGLRLIQAWLPAIVNGTAPRIEQTEQLGMRGGTSRTYVAKQVLQHKEIAQPVSMSMNQLWNTVRAFQFPGHDPAYLRIPNGSISLTYKWGDVYASSDS
ncbi:formyl transferase [Paenibacillus sp. 481]|nr:formyl transferase [Paenibacillus sp. 481]